MPRGAIIDGDLSKIHEVDLRDPEQIQEFVTHSWFKYPTRPRACTPGTASPSPTMQLGPNTKGTKTRIEEIDEQAKYSWIKAPRWRGHAMEVGPLARYVIGYAQGKPEFKEPVDSSC
jgi:hydrogenase large subunit